MLMILATTIAILLGTTAGIIAYHLTLPLSWRLFILVQRRRGNLDAVRWAETRSR